jgi:hypothetical protein
MTTTTHHIHPVQIPAIDDPRDDPLGDPEFSKLITGKPADDPISTLTWWLATQMLHATTEVNATLERGEPPARRKLSEALLFADLALDELADTTGAVGVATPLRPLGPGPSATAAAAAVRRSAVPVVRLLLTHQPSRPTALADALARHRRALRRAHEVPTSTAPRR